MESVTVSAPKSVVGQFAEQLSQLETSQAWQKASRQFYRWQDYVRLNSTQSESSLRQKRASYLRLKTVIDRYGILVIERDDSRIPLPSENSGWNILVAKRLDEASCSRQLIHGFCRTIASRQNRGNLCIRDQQFVGDAAALVMLSALGLSPDQSIIESAKLYSADDLSHLFLPRVKIVVDQVIQILADELFQYAV